MHAAMRSVPIRCIRDRRWNSVPHVQLLQRVQALHISTSIITTTVPIATIHPPTHFGGGDDGSNRLRGRPSVRVPTDLMPTCR